MPPADVWIDLGQVTPLCNSTDSLLVKMRNEIFHPTVNILRHALFPPNNGVTISLIFAWCLLVGVSVTRYFSKFTVNRAPLCLTHKVYIPSDPLFIAWCCSMILPVIHSTRAMVAGAFHLSPIPHRVCRAVSECNNFRSCDPHGNLQNCHFCLYAAGP